MTQEFRSQLSGPLPVSSRGARAVSSNQTTVNLPNNTQWFPGPGLNLNRNKLILQNPTKTNLGAANTTSVFVYRGGAQPPGALTGGMEIAPGASLYEDVAPSNNAHFFRLGAAPPANDSVVFFVEEA